MTTTTKKAKQKHSSNMQSTRICRLLLCPAQFYLQELNCSTANICRNSREPKSPEKKTPKERSLLENPIFWGFFVQSQVPIQYVHWGVSNLLALPGRARLGNNVVFIFVLPPAPPPILRDFMRFQSSSTPARYLGPMFLFDSVASIPRQVSPQLATRSVQDH